MKNTENFDKEVDLIVSNVIEGIEKDLFSQLDFSELKRQLAEFKVFVTVLPDTVKQFTSDKDGIDTMKKIVTKYQSLITQQEKELEKIDAIKEVIDKKMWCLSGATKQIIQIVSEKETDSNGNQT